MKLKWKNKVYSGALQFTIFISVIIALLLTGVIILISTHRYFIEQSRAIVDNIQLADTGMHYLQNLQNLTQDTISIDLHESREEQSVYVHLSNWGIYEKGCVKSVHRKKEFVKCALLGTGIKAVNRPALYLKETNKPLMVVGNTRIEGDAFLPEQGVRTGNITGHSYYNNQLIYGNIEKSSTSLPPLKYDYREIADFYMNQYQPSESENFIDLIPNTVNEQSFRKDTKCYLSPSVIVLENISIRGNIVIRSGEKIIIRKSALLNDVILAAPVIEIEDNTVGNFQAFADTTIKIGKNCKLNYPTALVLTEKKAVNPPASFNPYLNKIHIDQGTTLKGTICYLKEESEETGFTPSIYIAEQCEITGEIYCEKNLELRGNVNGSVFTSQFLTYEGGNNFINHLYNVTIAGNKLPETFGGILLENEQKKVAKWIY
ncbi:hypothetical protein [Flavobacterium beibuense]|uniref:Uncharacterized protein n=1 Tax=Flavobacterium beibuense TaxID=657326 RepID=A0A444W836_9FLAO|nr:hypothetical protein [Flavobacterium beibuense]RYJ42039.1 hypothetical protein NU09_2443 [Flavobacterium beibuense]